MFSKILRIHIRGTKTGRTDIICLELSKFASEYYKLAIDTFMKYPKDDQAIKELTIQLDLVMVFFDSIIIMFPTFSEHKKFIKIVINTCKEISEWKLLPESYKNKMQQKIKEQEQRIQDLGQ